MSGFDLHNYDDILHLEHHVSKKHPHMSVTDRAAQFGAFAALTGHEDAICETGRLTSDKTEISEEVVNVLNSRLLLIKNNIEDMPEITVIYFKPDELKDGGSYETYTGKIRRIDEVGGTLIFCDETEIPIDLLYDICSNDIIFDFDFRNM